jgi:murein DD-endopeptidase MepM/ murein hydrolase activator NlpD
MRSLPLLVVFSGACAAPPVLAVHGPDAAVLRGVAVLALQHDARQVHASIDGGEPFEVGPTLAVLDTRTWPDGEHVVTLAASTLLGGTTEARWTLTTDNSAPAPALWDAGLSVEQGHTLPIVVRTDEDPTELSVTFLGEERPLYPVGERTWRALVGVPIRTPAGPQPLVVHTADALGNRAERSVDVEVTPVDWPFTGKLPLSRRKARVDPPAMVKMRAERDAVYATATPEQQWQGAMGIPVVGADHTSAFGTFREYPDGKRSHHDAEDLARKRWTPIYAAADGVVALARYQAVHGNAVLLDHGQQVVTLYSHMQKHDVEEGQRVQRGDRLGWMGSTGRSTGPHLHWGIVVDQVAVDPMQWTETGFDPGADAVFVPL